MSATLEEKYQFLLNHLKITDIDRWEDDALIELKSSLYFQFSQNEVHKLDAQDLDFAVEQALYAERWSKENQRKIEEQKEKYTPEK